MHLHRLAYLKGSRSCRVVLLPLVVLGLLTAACAAATTGRELGEAPPSVAPAIAPPEEIIPLIEAGIEGFQISSAAFEPGAELPDEYTSISGDISPPLTIEGVPAGTVELALVVTDADNDGFVHWLVGTISPDTTTFEPGLLPPGAVAHLNGAGSFGWFAPSKALDMVHRYQFELYALNAPLNLAPDHDVLATIDAIERTSLSRSSVLAILIG